MYNKWAVNGGLYLGLAVDAWGHGETHAPVYDPNRVLAYTGDRGVVLLGPNGSGKTRRWLLANVARLTDWSKVIVDTKGVLAEMTEGILPGKRIIFDPFHVRKEKNTPFNGLLAIDPADDESVDDIMLMAESMFRVSERDPHWGEAAQEIAAGLLIYIRLRHRRDGNLSDFRRVLSLPPNRMRREAWVMQKVADLYGCDALVSKTVRFLEWTADDRETNSIMSTAKTQSRWLDSKPIVESMYGAKYIDFGDLKKEPTTIFLILPPHRLRTHSTWLRMMIAAILQPLMRDTSHKTVPVALFIDEAYATMKGGFPVIDENMAVFREYGIKLMLGMHDLAQASMLFGREGYQSFINNAGVTQSFAVQDPLSCKFLSDMSGEHFVPISNSSKGLQVNPTGEASFSKGEAVSYVRMPVVLPEHIRNMDAGYAILYSDRTNGPVRSYLPYPTEIPWLKKYVARDPSA